MFDWFWKGVAAIAGLAAFWFGFNARRTKLRMERDAAERDAAERGYLNKLHADLERVRREGAGKAPIRPDKRTGFE